MFKPENDIYRNWNKDIYIATRTAEQVELDDYGNQIQTFNEPFYLGKVNYQPLTKKDLEAYYKEYGATTNNIVSFLLDYRKDGLFNKLDIAYLYGATPDGEVINGDNANYIIRAYKPQNTKIMVILEEMEDK